MPVHNDKDTQVFLELIIWKVSPNTTCSNKQMNLTSIRSIKKLGPIGSLLHKYMYKSLFCIRAEAALMLQRPSFGVMKSFNEKRGWADGGGWRRTPGEPSLLHIDGSWGTTSQRSPLVATLKQPFTSDKRLSDSSSNLRLKRRKVRIYRSGSSTSGRLRQTRLGSQASMSVSVLQLGRAANACK